MKSALISADGVYRYSLYREIPEVTGENRNTPIVFCMLNPSTADTTIDDPTIRRCLGFARRLGYGKLQVVNLYAVRETDPKNIRSHGDPVGPENAREVAKIIRDLDFVVCAWGSYPGPDIVDSFLKILNKYQVTPMCLGVTKDGCPRHPLYLKADSPLVPWDSHRFFRRFDTLY